VSHRILVAGLGNVLMSDDAIGPYCVEHLLATCEFGPDVAVVDLGTPGLDLALHVAVADVVLAIDAIHGVDAGAVQVVDRSALKIGSRGARVDTHALALEEAIALVELVRGSPLDVALVGCGGARFEQGTGLSPVVRERVGALADVVLEELSRRGGTWRRREPVETANPWWERPAVILAMEELT
jgi:hydrogenase maturation protease